MKFLRLLTVTAINFFTIQASFAQGHAHHPPHNMLLFGEDRIYASHLVYRQPHNYQVVLRLDLDMATKALVAHEMRSYPNDTFIFLLDSMDISQIEAKPKISGKVFRRSSDETKHPILDKLELESRQYSVIYFSEIPLDLSEGKIVGF